MEEKVRAILRAAEITQGQLAERLNVSQPTVHRWLKGAEPRGDHRDLINEIFRQLTEGSSTEGPSHGSTRIHPGLIVVGVVSAGIWREADMKLEPYRLPVTPHPDYPAASQRLYKVEGTSVNRLVSDGSYIHAVDVAASGATPKPGDLVVVRRERHGTAEYTAKRYLVEGGKRILRPESNDPRWQDDVEINGDDDTEIVISDIAIAEWKSLRQA